MTDTNEVLQLRIQLLQTQKALRQANKGIKRLHRQISTYWPDRYRKLTNRNESLEAFLNSMATLDRSYYIGLQVRAQQLVKARGKD